jgi:hypothetical protein
LWVPQLHLVLLYAICSFSKSFLEPYDAGFGYTPALAKFARSGKVWSTFGAAPSRPTPTSPTIPWSTRSSYPK